MMIIIITTITRTSTARSISFCKERNRMLEIETHANIDKEPRTYVSTLVV